MDGHECRRLAGEILERLSLTDAADREVRTYSGGMRRRLDIGASLIGRPRVLFLDEPTTGLDPRTRNELWEFIEELVASGTTLLLTTQYMEEAERLADRIVVIDAGRVIARGTTQELKEQLGGDVLEVRVSNSADLDRAAELIAELGEGRPHVNPHERLLSVPTNAGTRLLMAAARRLEEDGVELDDLGIRHPSLDDVSLALTGKPSADGSNGGSDGTPTALPRATLPDPQPDGEAPTAPAPRLSPAVGARDTAAIAKRNLLRTLRTPRLLLIAAIQPALLLILFRYVLGGAIRLPHGSYVEYVVPAIFLEAVMIGGMATAIGLAEDLKSGIIDRFRSLPMARPAVLAGRTVADLARSAFSLAVMVGLGLLVAVVGFSFHTAIPDILLGMALVLAFGFAFSWMYATIALSTKDPETAQVAAVLPFFVLVFASSAVVPVASMPSWLQGFALHQPVSVTIDAVRALLEGGAAGHWVWQSLAWSAGILVVFFTLSVRLYRNVTS